MTTAQEVLGALGDEIADCMVGEDGATYEYIDGEFWRTSDPLPEFADRRPMEANVYPPAHAGAIALSRCMWWIYRVTGCRSANDKIGAEDDEIETAKRLHASAGILPSEWLPAEIRRQPYRVMRWNVEEA
jgi:hypothetical protein